MLFRSEDEIEFNGAFIDTGTGDTHEIDWDFGDGNSSSGSLTEVHSYSEPGTYNVTFTVTDDDGGIGTDWTLIEVISASEAADQVLDQVLEMELPQALNDSYTDKFESVIISLDNENNVSAINKLENLIKHIQKDWKNDLLSDEEAAVMISAALWLLQSLEDT